MESVDTIAPQPAEAVGNPSTKLLARRNRPSWPHRVMTWFRLKMLLRELRSSEKFQRECEKLHCKNLAVLQEKYRDELKDKIRRLESGAG